MEEAARQVQTKGRKDSPVVTIFKLRLTILWREMLRAFRQAFEICGV
jgi:hypothetical protein